MNPTIVLLIVATLSQLPAYGQDNPNDSLIGTRVWKVPPLPLESDKIVYKGEGMPGAYYTKDRLYNKAYDYFKYNMTDGDVKIAVADKAAGHISGLGKITYNQSVVMHNKAQAIYFNYDVWVKNGSYQYRISDIKATAGADRIDYSYMYREEEHPVNGHERWTHKYRYEMLSDMDSFIKLMIKGLEGRMTEK